MLIDTINQDIIDMMKTKNPDLVTLRTFKSEIQKTSIDTKKPITDEMVIDVAAKSVKQYSDALQVMCSGGPIYSDYEHRIKVLSKYLPAQLSEEEVTSIVNEVKTEVGAVTKRDMGKMMKVLQPKLKGKFDAKRLSQIVTSVLEG